MYTIIIAQTRRNLQLPWRGFAELKITEIQNHFMVKVPDRKGAQCNSCNPTKSSYLTWFYVPWNTVMSKSTPVGSKIMVNFQSLQISGTTKICPRQKSSLCTQLRQNSVSNAFLTVQRNCLAANYEETMHTAKSHFCFTSNPVHTQYFWYNPQNYESI